MSVSERAGYVPSRPGAAGGNSYEIYFEHFADEITLDRDHRTKDIQLWMQRYAERLEHYARLAPYNWFNFYPFWDQALPG
jgi:predicted LPLAT superfamily acyltransferase